MGIGRFGFPVPLAATPVVKSVCGWCGAGERYGPLYTTTSAAQRYPLSRSIRQETLFCGSQSEGRERLWGGKKQDDHFHVTRQASKNVIISLFGFILRIIVAE